MKESTSTRGSCPTASAMSAMRSSAVKSGDFSRVVRHRHDQPVEHLEPALDDGEVAVGEGVERSRVDGCAAGHGGRGVSLTPGGRSRSPCRRRCGGRRARDRRPCPAEAGARRARPRRARPARGSPSARRERRLRPLRVGRVDEGQREAPRGSRAGRAGSPPAADLDALAEPAGLGVPAPGPRRPAVRAPRRPPVRSRARAPPARARRCPAYRSSTSPPSKNWPSRFNTAPRTLSLVGRVASPRGTASRRPRACRR